MKKIYLLICLSFYLIKISAQDSLFYKDSLQQDWVDKVYQSLSLEEKVGQLFIVAAYSNKTKSHEDEILNLVKNEAIGGLIFMQNNPLHQLELTNLYQANAKTPLLIGIDGEWGLSMRLNDTHKFPYAMTLGAIQNDSLIYKMGAKIADHCQQLGIHWNFAPVVDVNTNPKNPIIGNRSFGSDVQNVSNKGIAYSKGMQDAHVLASAKHFPGHGDTSSDSHKTLPTVNHDLSRLQAVELQPFQSLINGGVMGIMVAHLDVPSLESKNIPSTLSKAIVTDLLQNQMHFEGLIITDALNMQGVASKYSPGIVDLKAFEAGNDILLFSQNVKKAKAEILKKLESGEISMERLEKSVRKILSAKYYTGLNESKPLTSNSLLERLNDEESDKLTFDLFKNAATLVQSDGSIPFTIGNPKYFLSIGSDNSTFKREFSAFSSYSEISSAQGLVNQDVVIGVFMDTSSPFKSYKLNASDIKKIESAALQNNVTLVVFGSPYSLMPLNISNIKNIVVMYENNGYTQSILPKLLYGEYGFKGKLPVDIKSELPYGAGVVTNKLKGMLYASPESQGMSSAVLDEIDNIAAKSIANLETPGMQVLVAKNGKIIFEKAYGYSDYYQTFKVDNETVYDLASVTKVLSTLPIFMQLYDQQVFRLDDYISEYFPYVIGTDKSTITFRELLLHNSGLKSWIPFYKNTFDYAQNLDNLYYQNFISEQYRYPVANRIFSRFTVKDMVYESIANSALQAKQYDYSDLGYYIIQYAIESHYKKPLNIVFEKEFTEKMELESLTFRPLEKIDIGRIPPTEVDNVYRNQTIQGYVQDQGAALMGGVAGHAGLFGNSKDVASMMQMYLNGGKYNEQSFIDAGTIGYFSSYQNSSRRGLGFDKQRGDNGPFFDNAPASGFGHTGYTGTMVWADPVEQLVFVFLSNRTFPSASSNKLNRNKTRQKILKKVYDAKLSL